MRLAVDHLRVDAVNDCKLRGIRSEKGIAVSNVHNV